MGKQATPKRGITPPKGRPTRARNDAYREKRVFGATAQWIALTLLIVLVFVVLFILTDGGSYFGNDGGVTGSLIPLLSLASTVT